MARSVDEDYKLLADFVCRYSLAGLIKNEDYCVSLKQGHKAYLILLTLWSIIEHKSTQKPIEILGVKLDAREKSFVLLRESISDFGSAYFCCIQGSYRPGYMVLRSNIENFVRAISGLCEPKALKTTNLRELFCLAKKTFPFVGERAGFLEQLHNVYKELCKYTHTASHKHMSGVGSLQHFPAFNKNWFGKWAKMATKVMKNEVSCLLSLSPLIYNKSHFKTKDVLDLGFDSDKTRLAVLGVSKVRISLKQK